VGQNGDVAGAVDADALVGGQSTQRGPRERTRWAALEPPDDRIAIPPDDEKGVAKTPSVAGRGGGLTTSSPRGGDAFRPPSGRRSSSGRGEVIRASYEEAAEKPATDASRAASGAARSRPDSARFGFAPDYTWLLGKLEHSQASGEWKLRYIPIDGTTDQYGGSVILENPQSLGDLAAGDYVRIRGELLDAKRDGMTFAPIYRVVETQGVAD
jgi:hypothetical protein